jgi:hypothetical protein
MQDASTILAARETDITHLVGELRNLLAKAGDNSFLVVNAGDPWVQFMALPQRRAFTFEAVGNEYLPKKLQLDAERSAALVALGFETPEQTGVNFSMDRSIGGDGDFDTLAALAILVLFEIYRCPIETPLTYELNLE